MLPLPCSLRRLGIVLAAAASAAAAEKTETPNPPLHLKRSSVFAPNGVVAANHPLASQAGLDVLKRGGNAIDAAVTAAAVMNLTEPMMTGIGGDLFAIVWLARERRLVGLNASGRGGSLLTVEALRAAGHAKMPVSGAATVTVPGALSGWAALLDRYGTIKLAEALDPAAQLAEQGYPMSPVIAAHFELFEPMLATDAATRRPFQIEGRSPRTGEWYANPDLARTFRDIAKHGPAWFYGGELGTKLVNYVRGQGGFLTLEDLKSHRSEWVEPMSARFGEYKLWELPPNGQGIAALEMIRILEGFDLPAMGHNSADYFHHLIEAKKLAYADLEEFVGDPELMKVPAARLLQDSFIAQRRSQLDPQRAKRLPEPGPALTHSDTTYLCTADRDGNMVSFINSVSGAYGAGLVVPGTGFVLQNRGAGFTMQPNRVNTAAPKRRPFHTIIPGFITRVGADGRDEPWVSFGIMGGPNQPQAHVQVMLNLVVFGMDAQAALDAPRFRHMTEDNTILDRRIPQAVIASLEARGHRVTEPRPAPDAANYGTGHIIRRLKRGYEAGSDTRTDGLPAGH